MANRANEANGDSAALLTAVPESEGHGAPGDARGRRDLSVIERQSVTRRIVRFLSTTLLVTMIVGLVGALVLHATIIENQRELDQQRSQILRIAGETEALRSELAELEAPARIVEDALDLGMIEAPSIEYITAPAGPLDERTLIIAENNLLDNE